MGKRRCIFCGRTEDDFDTNNQWSIEHIIPESIGNRVLRINDVCQKCNNQLGKNVDHFYVNHRVIELIRNCFGLKGKKGKLPNPFLHAVDQDGNQLKVDEQQRVSIFPRLSMENHSNGGYHLKGIANSKEEAKALIQARLKRKPYSQEQIDNILKQVDQTDSKPYQPIVQSHFEFEPNRIALFMLKIAYEYSCLRLGDAYYSDGIAIKARKMLYDAICDKMKNSCPFTPLVQHSPPELRDNLLSHLSLLLPDKTARYHILLLHPDKSNQLICEIYLFYKEEDKSKELMNKYARFSVIVSEHANKYITSPDDMPLDIIPVQSI